MFPVFWRVSLLAVVGFSLWGGALRVRAQSGAGAAGTHARVDGEPVHLTAEQDRERMLRLLGITDSAMRPLSSTDAKACSHRLTRIHGILRFAQNDAGLTE